MEMSARGVAYLAGLAAGKSIKFICTHYFNYKILNNLFHCPFTGLCRDYDVLNEMESGDMVFEPKIGNKQYLFGQFVGWKKAQRRFTKWYHK